ncbi:MAG TPA: C1 family peptidase [Terriglobales bacterium]|nr:C1 family peptidase [Terriglobales bacterium]
MPRKVKHYGWVPDLPDPRDFLFAAPPAVLQNLPPSVDLRPGCPDVYDQGDLGSCTANAIGGAFEFAQKKNKFVEFVPSRLFIYYNERVLEGTADQDSGAHLRDGIKSVVKQGVCPETDWTYTTDLTVVTKKPADPAYATALNNKAISYHRILQNLSQMKGCLADGFPFVFGFTVYAPFEGDEVRKTGIVPMPNPAVDEQAGGHAVMAVGYDDTQQRFLIRNSWGPAWGMSGYCTMPYAYLTDHQFSSDFWTIRGITGAAAAASAAA